MSGPHPLERQWGILQTLSARHFGATVRELSDEFSVSQKTIRRDLSLLCDLGFPISHKEGAHGRNHWVAESNEGGLPFTFDISEVLALYLGRKFLEPLAGTVIWDSSHSAFRKIKTALKQPVLEYFDKLADLIHRTSFRDSCYQHEPQLIDELMVAIEDCRIAFLTYHSARSTEPVTYDVYPYGLVHHRGSLYLIAHSQQHDEVRTFKVDRISDVVLESLKFQKPPDFNLADYLQHSLGVFHSDAAPQRVIIRFLPEVSQYVREHHWHASQKLVSQKDGTLLAEFELSDLTEIKSWVLSFGSKATVEEPIELQKMVLHDLENAMKNYRPLKNSQEGPQEK